MWLLALLACSTQTDSVHPAHDTADPTDETDDTSPDSSAFGIDTQDTDAGIGDDACDQEPTGAVSLPEDDTIHGESVEW